MLNGRIRVALWAAATTSVLLLIAWVALPRIISALPGRVRQYLPAELAAEAPAPLPTPMLVADIEAIIEPEDALIVPTPTLAATDTSRETSDAPTAAAVTLATEEASPTPVPTATSEPTPFYPSSVYIEGVKIIPQKFNNCGPTNLAMVLNFHNIPVDQFDIAAEVRPTYEDRNVSPEELAGYVVNHTGLESVVAYGSDLTTLKRLLAAGLPVMIEQGLVPDDDTGWMGHYLTLYGYDEADGAFYARDSFLGPWEEDGRATYEHVAEHWQMFNNVLLVTYPSERQAELDQILSASYSDPVIMWERAAKNARASIRHNGADPFAWFNLGTSLTKLYGLTADTEQLNQAVASFDQARLLGLPPRMLWYQFAPYEAYLAAGRTEDVIALAEATLTTQGGRSVEETYIYRGLALQARGDSQGAEGDFIRAELLHPGNPLLQRVLATQP